MYIIIYKLYKYIFLNLGIFLIVFIRKELVGRLLRLQFGFMYHHALNRYNQKILIQNS